jgi:ABC-type nickel/cobalt efflux system permease component RcnA
MWRPQMAETLLPQLLLVASVAAVGVLHTMVPDHWMPIALLARQRGWTRAQTASAALKAGTGHVGSTLLIAVVVWYAGAVAAARFGHVVDSAASIALIAFGGWIAWSGWRALTQEGHKRHDHHHGAPGSHDHHHHGHSHAHERRSSTALLLILGSSPMIEGIPAFFAAGKYGAGLIVVMSLVFAASTIATYIVLCIQVTAGLQRLHVPAFERYGEVLSGAVIAALGAAFWFWPIL